MELPPVRPAVDRDGVVHLRVVRSFTWRSQIAWSAGGTLCAGRMVRTIDVDREVDCGTCVALRASMEREPGK